MGRAVLTSSNAAWAWPTGVTRLIAEAVGAGGGGGGETGYPAGGGGGKGGSYCRSVIDKGAETTLNITVASTGGTAGSGGNGGAGGVCSIVQDAATVLLAPGGAGGGGATTNNHSGTGGTAENGVAVFTEAHYAGGDGADGNQAAATSGAGGGAGGPSGAGTAGSGTTYGSANATLWSTGISYSGNGANGRATSENNGIAGSNYGGGGSGGLATDATNHGGGAGAPGLVVLTWAEFETAKASDGPADAQPQTITQDQSASPATPSSIEASDGPAVGVLDQAASPTSSSVKVSHAAATGLVGAVHATDGPPVAQPVGFALDAAPQSPSSVHVTDQATATVDGAIVVAPSAVRVSDAPALVVDPVIAQPSADGLKVSETVDAGGDKIASVSPDALRVTDVPVAAPTPACAVATESLLVGDDAPVAEPVTSDVAPNVEVALARESGATGLVGAVRAVDGPPVALLGDHVASAEESARPGDAAPTAVVSPLVAAPGADVARATDGQPVAVPDQVAAAQDTVGVTDGAAAATVSPLAALPADESIHAADQQPVTAIGDYLVPVVAEPTSVVDGGPVAVVSPLVAQPAEAGHSADGPPAAEPVAYLLEAVPPAEAISVGDAEPAAEPFLPALDASLPAEGLTIADVPVVAPAAAGTPFPDGLVVADLAPVAWVDPVVAELAALARVTDAPPVVEVVTLVLVAAPVAEAAVPADGPAVPGQAASIVEATAAEIVRLADVPPTWLTGPWARPAAEAAQLAQRGAVALFGAVRATDQPPTATPSPLGGVSASATEGVRVSDEGYVQRLEYERVAIDDGWIAASTSPVRSVTQAVRATDRPPVVALFPVVGVAQEAARVTETLASAVSPIVVVAAEGIAAADQAPNWWSDHVPATAAEAALVRDAPPTRAPFIGPTVAVADGARVADAVIAVFADPVVAELTTDAAMVADGPAQAVPDVVALPAAEGTLTSDQAAASYELVPAAVDGVLVTDAAPVVVLDPVVADASDGARVADEAPFAALTPLVAETADAARVADAAVQISVDLVRAEPPDDGARATDADPAADLVTVLGPSDRLSVDAVLATDATPSVALGVAVASIEFAGETLSAQMFSESALSGELFSDDALSAEAFADEALQT